jgi:hypothetical protein
MTEQPPAVNDEAVEAAKRVADWVAFDRANRPDRSDDATLGISYDGHWITRADLAAVTAALPFLSQQVDPREQIAQRILDQEHTHAEAQEQIRQGKSVDWVEGYDRGIHSAARVAREIPLTGGGES